MRIRNRSILIMAFQGITQLSQLLIGIILVRLISKDMYGSYRQVMLAHGLIAGLLSLQIESSLYYFLPKLGAEKRRELLFQTLFTTGVLSVVVGLAMFLSADLFAEHFNNPELSLWIKVFALFPLCEQIIRLQPAFLISLDKALLSGIYSMLSTVLMVLSVVVFFAVGYGITEALVARIVTAAVFAVVGLGILFHFSQGGQWRFNKSLWLEQLHYCWPLMATTIVGIVNLKLDGVLISSYFSKEVYAVYSVGALELPLITLFTSSISSAIMPNMVAEADQGRRLNALNLWHAASRKSSLLIFPTFVFFVVCGYDFIVWLYTPEYSQAAWPFLVYLARLPFRVAIYGAIFRAIGYTKPLVIAALLSLTTNIVVSVTLLVAGRHGFLSYIGPSVGTFWGSMVSISFLLTVLRRRLDIRFVDAMRWKELGRVFGLSAACGLALWLIPIPIESLFLKLTIRFILYVLLFFASLALTKSLQADEWELLRMPLTLVRTLARKKRLT